MALTAYSRSSLGRLKTFLLRSPVNKSVTSIRSDAPDLVRSVLSKPDVSRASCDAIRATIVATVFGVRKNKLSNHALGSDAPDLVAIVLGKPEVAIWARRDAPWITLSSRSGELSDDAFEGNAPNRAPIVRGKPEVAIRTQCDADRVIVSGRETKCSDLPGRCMDNVGSRCQDEDENTQYKNEEMACDSSFFHGETLSPDSDFGHT